MFHILRPLFKEHSCFVILYFHFLPWSYCQLFFLSLSLSLSVSLYGSLPSSSYFFFCKMCEIEVSPLFFGFAHLLYQIYLCLYIHTLFPITGHILLTTRLPITNSLLLPSLLRYQRSSPPTCRMLLWQIHAPYSLSSTPVPVERWSHCSVYHIHLLPEFILGTLHSL